MISPIVVVLLVIVSFVLGIGWHRYVLTKPAARQTVGLDPVIPAPAPEPVIVVNVPTDWKPAFPPMPESEMSGARAHLWYAVYELTLRERGRASSSDCVDRADAAVDKAFGPLP